MNELDFKFIESLIHKPQNRYFNDFVENLIDYLCKVFNMNKEFLFYQVPFLEDYEYFINNSEHDRYYGCIQRKTITNFNFKLLHVFIHVIQILEDDCKKNYLPTFRTIPFERLYKPVVIFFARCFAIYLLNYIDIYKLLLNNFSKIYNDKNIPDDVVFIVNKKILTNKNITSLQILSIKTIIDNRINYKNLLPKKLEKFITELKSEIC